MTSDKLSAYEAASLEIMLSTLQAINIVANRLPASSIEQDETLTEHLERCNRLSTKIVDTFYEDDGQGNG